MLSYSPNGGRLACRSSCCTLPAGAGSGVVAGTGAGDAELAYVNAGQEYLVAVPYPQFVAARRR